MKTNAYDTNSGKKSPFAVYSTERLTFLGSNASTHDVELNDVDKLVTLSVNEMLVATSKLLHTYLVQLGLKSVDIDDIRASLKKLSGAGYLTKMEFTSPTGKSLNKVYSLDTRGQAFVKSKGKHPMLSAYIYGLDATGVKRILSALQFVISQNYISKAKSIAIASVVAERGNRDATESAHIFRPNATVRFEDKTVFVESVRRSPANEDELLNKLNRMDDCLKHSKYLNVSVNDTVKVVVVCEDCEHMDSVYRAIKASGTRFCFELIFTNDSDVYNNPNDCLYKYEYRKTFFEKTLAAFSRIVG